ncbi:MAG: FHA domain-containing protein [Anaerolineae bacterium]
MSDELKPTKQLEISEEALLEAARRQRTLGTARLGKVREVMLLVDQEIRQLSLHNDVSYLLGRFDRRKPSGNHIDLSPFKANERGVSRIHAQIHMANDRLYITDMDSTNGTIVDGARLQPHQAVVLRQGSDVLLGRLHIQIMYKSTTEDETS